MQLSQNQTIFFLELLQVHLQAQIIYQLILRKYIFILVLQFVCLILFFIFQGIELFIIFTGMTIFMNKLSIIRNCFFNLEIFFHSMGILLLAWFIFQQWTYTFIWVCWGIGGFIPLFFEMCGLIVIRLHYRKVLKIT